MSSCCTDFTNGVHAQFNEDIAEHDRKRYRRKGPNPTTRLLRNMVLRAGGGRSLLDIGGGIGALSFELLAAGVEQSTLVDASPAYQAVARNEAAHRGDSGRMTFSEGDFVSLGPDLPTADIVVLDRVVCCYPMAEPLLDEAFRHTSRVCALSYPRDTWLIRMVTIIQNRLRAIRHSAFRVYVHPAKTVEAAAERHGFRRVEQGGTLIWSVHAYLRNDGATPAPKQNDGAGGEPPAVEFRSIT